MQSFVAKHWLLLTLAMLKVWKAPGCHQTQIFPISFFMRNGKNKWIQLKSYCRYPYDFFFKVKVHNVYFKTVILLVNIRFISLPKVIKKMKSTPQNNFFMKNIVFWKLYHVSKNSGMVLRIAYIQTISKNKNKNQTSRLGVECRIVKKGVFPQNAKTMSYD